MNLKRSKGMAMGMAGAACWGLSGVFINLLSACSAVNPVWVGFMRMLISGIVFLLIALLTSRDNLFAMFKDPKAMGGVVVFAILGMAVFQVTYVLAIQTAGAAAESLIAQIFLVYMMIYTCRANNRAPRKGEVAGVALALVGVFCIATKGDASTLAIGTLGLVLCLSDSVLQFVHNIAPLYALQKYGSIPVNAAGALLAMVLLLPFAHPWDVAVLPTAQGWGWLFASALVGAVLGYVLSLQALKEVGPFLGSLTLVFEPLTSVIASVVALGIPFTPFDLLGTVAILVMMVIMNWEPPKDAHGL